MEAAKMKKSSMKSIGQRLAAVRDQIRSRSRDDYQLASNDLLNDLEMRWGPGFAQWIADDLKDASR
jgi:hypothetical protein